jgi:hypothetical protein
MSLARKMALAFLSPLFVVLLFMMAFDVGFVRTATHPTTVKKLAAESGIYDSVVPSLLQQTKSISTSVGSVDTNNPLIQKAANAAITPQYIQQNAEAAIDSVYKWLDGDIAQPDFVINLNEAKNNFADQIAISAQQQLTGLPACKTQAQAAAFNALNAACLPRGVTPASAAQLLKNDLSSSQGFLEKTTISADSLKSSDGGPSVFQDKLKNVPQQYQRAKKTPLILSVLTILCGVGIVFASRSWQMGLRHLGITLVIVGVLMMIFAWTLNREVTSQIVPKIKLDNAALQTDIRNLADDLTRQINKNYWFFGGLYAAVGAGGIAAAEVFRRRAEPAIAKASSKKPEPAGKTPPAEKLSGD